MVEMFRSLTFEVELLSPVHIGNGRNLGKYELAVIGGRLWRFDPGRVLQALSGDPAMLERYLQDGASVLATWREGSRQTCARYDVEWSGAAPGNVREHLADSLGRPYLPGSALKGAIRSAILWACHWSLPEEVKARQRSLIGREQDPRSAGRPLQQRFFGKDPHHDLLRALRPEDSAPISPERLGVAEVRIAVAEPDTSLAWFVGPHRHVADPRRGAVLWAEVLPAGLRTRVRVTLDRFLTENATEVGQEAPCLPARELGLEGRRKLLDAWTKSCNLASRERAVADEQWASALGFEAWAGFYRWLLAEMQRVPDAVYLQLGWGVGWRGKTAVEPLGVQAVDRARQKYRLGRAGSLFPKTRRVLFLKGEPRTPLGWLRLRPISPSPSGGSDARGRVSRERGDA
jgi:CRISPR-associated protein Csm5